MMLQHLISYFTPLPKKMQMQLEALLSANEEYVNEHVIEFESLKGKQEIPDRCLHLFMDELTDGQRIFPFLRYKISYEFNFSFTQRIIDE